MRVERKYRFDASRQIALSLFEQIQLARLCLVARRLDARHAIPATSSNMSVRRDGKSFLVSRSGKHKRELHPSDFLLVDFDGQSVAKVAPKASDETLLHALIYRNCPWIHCIIHCHAPELEFLRAPGITLDGHELLKAFGAPDHDTSFELNVFQNDQDMSELARLIGERQLNKNTQSRGPILFTLAQHGLYCGGESVAKAEAYLEALLHLLPFQAQRAKSVIGKKYKDQGDTTP